MVVCYKTTHIIVRARWPLLKTEEGIYKDIYETRCLKTLLWHQILILLRIGWTSCELSTVIKLNHSKLVFFCTLLCHVFGSTQLCHR